MAPRLPERLSHPHGAVSQERAAYPRTHEEELREADLARVVGGTDGRGSIDVGNDPQLKASPILF